MTAVQWLKEQFLKHELVFDPEIKNFEKYLFEQALEMEKQQIMEAFQYKFFHPYVENEPEQYYNETYKPST